MANDPARGQGRSWKQQATPGERKQEAQPQWRREPAASSTQKPRWSKKAKLGLTSLGLLVFCGLLIWAILLLMPPKPACLVAIVADYEDNLAIPPNFYGRTAAEELVALTQSGSDSYFWGSGLLRLKQAPQELRTDQAWDHNLEKFNEKTLVLFFAVHGGADRQGAPGEGAYLLPQDSDGRQEEKYRLRLKRILSRLAELPPKKNKVLILDATQVMAYWPLGILHNDFARQLDELEPEIATVPNLLVLSASAIDQRSWVSEEWRTTVFSHFLIEGLRGAASPDRGGRINALDLYQYVGKNVEAWVRANRDALQQPVMLPKGDRGKNLARNIDLVLVKEPYQPANPEENPPVEDFSELQKAWTTFQRLEKSVPSPTVYSPHLWRQYQEYLLRYEQVVRLGDKKAAEDLAKLLANKEEEIRQAQHLELGSAQNSLAMPAAAGLGPFHPEQLSKDLDELWTSQPDKAAEVWEKIQINHGATTKAGQQLLRAEMGVQLVNRAADDPAKYLKKAAEIGQIIWKGSASLAPAEMQFLFILNRDGPWDSRPSSGYFDGVKKALTVRLLAEQTALAIPPKGHPYSEQVYPWIEEKVIAADKERLRGQDRLLASDHASWEQALKDLNDAQTKYGEAQEIAKAVRDALEVRDQGFERLPWYSRWLARRRPRDDSQKNDADLMHLIENLWENLHQLDHLLDKPEPRWIRPAPPAKGDELQPRSIIVQTEVVRRGLVDLQTKFSGLCQDLSTVDLQSVWRDADDALVVPFIEPVLRMKLLANSRRTSQRFLMETAQKGSEASSLPPQKNEEQAKLSARAQGRLALAVLGKRAFDQDQEAGRENYLQVQRRLETFQVEENWWTSLSEAGEQVGQRWQHLPGESQRLVENGWKAATEQARTGLQTADRFTRLMEAGVGLSLADNPVTEYRRWLTQELLGWQAQRTWEDHLFDLDPKAEEPYYRLAGTLYLEDARRLDPLKLRWQTLEPIQQKLDGPGNLLPDGPVRRNITSEQSFVIDYGLRPAKGAQVPSGFPVIGVKIGKGELQLVDRKASDRLIRKVGGDAAVENFAVTLKSPLILEAEKNPPPLPRDIPATVTAVGLYRGQVIPLETSVHLYPLPEMAQVQPQVPARGSVAVRADPAMHRQFGRGRGAIEILLDCSGSMWSPQEAPYPLPKGIKVPEGCRFDKAVTALEEVLSELDPGTWVSVWIFGHYEEGGSKERGPIRHLREMERWNKNDLKVLMAKVRKEIPYFGTPLVKTMSKAKNDFDALPKDFQGFKSIVVLTDGRDEEFVETGGLEGIKSIPEFVEKKFKDSGISINMCFFQLTAGDEKAAKESFKGIENRQWRAPGKLYHIKEDPKDLIVALRKSLQQSLRYSVEEDDGSHVAGMPPDGLDVSAIGANDHWFLEGLRPADYWVRVQINELKKKRISVEGGDRLLLQLTTTPKGPDFQRLLYSQEPEYREKPAGEQEGWRLAVLQNQRVNEQGLPGLRMFVTLEKKHDPDAYTLKQYKPTETWMEIKPPPEDRQLFAVRWRALSGYPGPSWSFHVPQWPIRSDTQAPAPPSLHAWWSDQPFSPTAALKRGRDNFDNVQELVNRPVGMEGEEVIIESVRLEEHQVEFRPGQFKKEACLVVRLGQVKNKPVWVRLEGIETWGHEHRFYTQAGKYTAIFWPVTADKVKNVTGLSFISLNTFKRDAERGKLTLVKPLGEPQANDDRPQTIPLTHDNDPGG